MANDIFRTEFYTGYHVGVGNYHLDMKVGDVSRPLAAGSEAFIDFDLSIV